MTHTFPDALNNEANTNIDTQVADLERLNSNPETCCGVDWASGPGSDEERNEAEIMRTISLQLVLSS
jgi:hypothetical protein